MNCPQCDSPFTARLGAKPQRYCSPKCRQAAYRARADGPEQRNAGSTLPDNVTNVTRLSAAPKLSAGLPVEWLDCYPDLQRCVAGILNPRSAGKSVPREDAVGMDRPPIGHAVHTDGGWPGNVRSNGAVVWVSERFANLEPAKAAVLERLAESPEVVAAAMRVAA